MSEVNIYEVGTSDYSSDYIGFTFNGIHSDILGIKRTSEGSRFNENLLPTMQDKTVQVPGGDGTYYFGSYYTQRQFTVNFAFDSLTEEQFAQLQTHFGDKGIHDLIFDERPYKVYSAKVTGTATIKHIPFAEGATNRIYKGEGTVQFTCYTPYARSRYKWLNEYDNTNKEEWAVTSGLLAEQGDYDKVVSTDRIKTYNPGVKASDFILKIETLPESDFSISALLGFGDGSSTSVGKLEFSSFKKVDGDAYIVINSKNNLIEGYNEDGKKTGNLYNQYIKDGEFFKIPIGLGTMLFTKLTFNNGETPLTYNYYYF